MLRSRFLSFLTVLFAALAFSSAASAQLEVNINQATPDPIPIAVPALSAQDASTAGLGKEIMAVVAADLERSGLFRPIPESAFIEKLTFGQTLPRFPDWRQINAQGLVTGTIENSGAGQVKVTFRLWDVLAETQKTGKEFNTLTGNWRRVAHLIADEIYKSTTGEGGYFDTRVVYVAESGPAKRRIKRLAIMDQDGANHKFLTDGKNLVLTPRFSPNSQEVLYMAYQGRSPKVYLRDLQTGREQVVGTFEGMSFAPRFSFDGKKVIMSIAKNGVTNIHEMNLATKAMRQVTNSNGIDTSPSYSPDGKQIVFNSDRGGSQQIYVMNADGSGVKRISFEKGNYSTPVWSPRGDLIAFTKMTGGQFYIGVMRPDGTGERTITSSWLDEGPTWAPNGRVIMFSRGERSRGATPGRSKVYSIDITGRNLREVITPTDASDPAWSPLLRY
ncbi:MAG: Tol-Pal system protein TolB [Alphaproteobacteria bacterium]|nr:Tol-Pal system protein TolB [Alphaproteobacteria bacterium]